MEAAGLAVDALGRVRDMVHDALKDLSPKEILARPDHTSRGWCGIVPRAGRKFSAMMDRSQLWVFDGWHARSTCCLIQRTTAPVTGRRGRK